MPVIGINMETLTNKPGLPVLKGEPYPSQWVSDPTMFPDIFQEPPFHRLCGTPAGQVLCGLLTHISPPVQAVFGGLLIWLVTVRAFRWNRYNAIHRQFQAKHEELTPEEAQKIIQVSTLYDMPLLLNYALAFALFKTYGIVSWSNSATALSYIWFFL